MHKIQRPTPKRFVDTTDVERTAPPLSFARTATRYFSKCCGIDGVAVHVPPAAIVALAEVHACRTVVPSTAYNWYSMAVGCVPL